MKFIRVGLFSCALLLTGGLTVAEEQSQKVSVEDSGCPPGDVLPRLGLELFLDPSAAKRQEITLRFVRDVFEHAPCDEPLEPCYGDFSVLEEVLMRSAHTQRVEHCQRTPKTPFVYQQSKNLSGVAVDSQRDARSACLKASRIDSKAPGCTEDQLMELARVGDPLAGEILSRVQAEDIDEDARMGVEVVRRWLSFIEAFPDRQVRLARILDLPGQFVTRSDGSRVRAAASQTLREWALDELLGPDPRKWAPADVALVLERATREDALIRTKPVGSAGPSEQQPEERLQVYLDHLRPMGLQRVVVLGGLRSVQLPPGPVAHAPDSNYRCTSKLLRYQHFSEELGYYRREWERARPGAGKDPDVRTEKDEYIERRWFETDALAPHPDLGALRAALARPRKHTR